MVTELCKQDIYFALGTVGKVWLCAKSQTYILVIYNSQTRYMYVPVVVTVMACIIGDSSPTSICMTIKHYQPQVQLLLYYNLYSNGFAYHCMPSQQIFPKILLQTYT